MLNKDFFNLIFKSGIPNSENNAATQVPEWIKLIDHRFQKMSYTKGNVIQTINQIPDSIYYLRKGLVRAYYLNSHDKQITFDLWEDNTIVTDITNYMYRRPSDLRIEVCNNAELIAIHRLELEQIINQYPEAYQLLNAITLYALAHHRDRDKNRYLTASQKLDKFRLEHKNLEHTVSRDWIATFLGISYAWLHELYSEKKKHNNR